MSAAVGPVTVRVEVYDGVSTMVIARTVDEPMGHVFDTVVAWARAAAGLDGAAPSRPVGGGDG